MSDEWKTLRLARIGGDVKDEANLVAADHLRSYDFKFGLRLISSWIL